MIKHEIYIEDAVLGDMREVYRESIIKAVDAALDYEKINYACEISIEITDNATIQQLNKEFRGKNNITDVLSFPMMEINPETGAMMLGDVVISGERALEQSEEINQSFERELMFLTVHSILHLLGYDHELSEEADLIMRKKQQEIMGKIIDLIEE